MNNLQQTDQRQILLLTLGVPLCPKPFGGGRVQATSRIVITCCLIGESE